MPRKAVILECNAKDRLELERISRSRTESKQFIERAKIILDYLDYKQNKDIAAAHKTRPNRITKWRNRFAKHGLAGLVDAPRSGKPIKSVDLRARMLKMLKTPPPLGQANWDGKSLADSLNARKSTIWRILRKEGIQLQRARSWCVSTDKEFSAKSADIIGLYLNSPSNALEICVDEKPSIQALERKTGYVETSSGRIIKGLQCIQT